MASEFGSDQWRAEQDQRHANHMQSVAAAQIAAAEQRFVALLDAERKLSLVQHAMSAYFSALSQRQHGGVAAGRALDAIQTALGISWNGKQESTP